MPCAYTILFKEDIKSLRLLGEYILVKLGLGLNFGACTVDSGASKYSVLSFDSLFLFNLELLPHIFLCNSFVYDLG